jgi:hypothetical protein
MIFTKSPLMFVLFAVLFFAAGILVDKFFFKKSAVKPEKFEDGVYGLPSTVTEFANGPKVLPLVPQNVGVTDYDKWCKIAKQC